VQSCSEHCWRSAVLRASALEDCKIELGAEKMELEWATREQMALLRNAAARLRAENKLRLRVRVWGRVDGVAADYWLLHALQAPLHFYRYS
jgi:hypothetical protein